MANKKKTFSLAAAKHLFKIGHKTTPLMLLKSNSEEPKYTISFDFKNLNDSQDMYSALVHFFKGHS